MPKRFFFFTKSQRIATIALILIIVAVIVIDIFLPRILPPQKSFFDPKFTAEIKHFEEQLDSFELTNLIVSQHHYPKKINNTSPQKVLFNFDPNTLDSAGFVQLGLAPYVAKNIIRYRARGGVFREKTDFAKVYGITPNSFEELEPYIFIGAEYQENKELTDAKHNEQFCDSIIIELNSADTTQLKKIKGIGSAFAKRIVTYRTRLGGFISVEQLLEVGGINETLFRKIRPHIDINAQNIKKIDVNHWSVARMKNHPYMNFSRAKAIFDFREMVDKISSIEEMKHLEEFSEDDWKRLEPYLSFE